MKDQKNINAQNIQKNIQSSPILYKIDNWEALSDKEKKSYRRRMRSKLNAFKDNILGKDRSDAERKKSINAFKKFFKENYASKDLNAESIYSGSNPLKKKEYQEMIHAINA